MRLIISLLDTPAFGGAEQYLLSHLYELQKQPGLKVWLFTNRQSVKDRVETDGNQIVVKHLPYRLDAIGNWKGLLKYVLQAPLALLWFIVTMIKLSLRYKHITVYTPGFSDRMLFSPFIKLLGHHLVWLEFGPLQPLFRRNWGFPKLLYKLGRPFPDAVVTISQYTKQCMLRDTAMPEKKIHVIYPTTPVVTNNQLIELKKKGLEWKKKNKLVTKKIITFVGRLATEKEVDLLIQAFGRVLKKQDNAFLLIVGDGPEKNSYHALVKKMDLEKSVLFTGFVTESEKKILLAMSHIFVFPSAWELEGFGMTTIEAMMLGVPVISSGSGPQAEIVTNLETGLIFTPHTSRALALSILELLTRTKKSKTLGSNGRASILRMSKQHTQLINTIDNAIS